MTNNELKPMIMGLKDNDPIKQRELYDTYSPLFLNMANWYVKDMHLAENVVNTAFHTIFDKIHQYEGLGSFEGWMKKILVRTALNQIKSNESYKKRKVFVGDFTPIENDYHIKGFDTLEVKSNFNHITRNLSEKRKTIIDLRLHGYKLREIAVLMDVEMSTVKWHINEIIKNLSNNTWKK